MSRWRRISGATSETSCGTRKRRPRSSASARPAASRPSVARGLAPSRRAAAISGTRHADRVTRRHDEPHRVVLHRVVHEDLVDRALQLDELLERQHLRRLAAASRPCGARSRAPRRTTAGRRRSASGSGRAAPRAARTRLRTRSGSASRARGTASAVARVWPAIETWRSAMTSSSADCTLAGARLISSARTRFANTGPHSMSKSSRDGRHTRVPTMSAGTRSGVNCEPGERAADDLRRASRRSASWPGRARPR